MPYLLGRLGFSIVTPEFKLLACATLWPLLVTFLLSAPTGIACLANRMVRQVGRLEGGSRTNLRGDGPPLFPQTRADRQHRRTRARHLGGRG